MLTEYPDTKATPFLFSFIGIVPVLEQMFQNTNLGSS